MTFDWGKPDYDSVHAARASYLERIRSNTHVLPALRQHFAADPAAFIEAWGVTSDPRAKARGGAIEMPFVLFDRQREMLGFILDCMRNREPGLIEKSRDCGASWLVACLAATLCLHNSGVVVGIGSRTENKVDRSGDPDSLFWKIRFFLTHLPPEFRGGWDESKNSAHMRLTFPETGSAIVGEAGDAIGRGGRSTVYFIDEAAFIERPQLIEASLASNTECRIDVSTPNGRANSFAVKRHSGRVKVFTFGWRDDPRKDDAWYAKQCTILDPVTRAQEIDLSYDASVEGIVIPAEWVHAAIDAHKKLGIEPTGARSGALDVADEGKDRNALAGRHGILLEHLESWSGANSNIFKTTVRAMGVCDQRGYAQFNYDADGLGAGVRGDSVEINIKRRDAGKSEITADPFRGSGAVFDPDGSMVEGRLNKDFFANLKAQSWWALRLRFQASYRAVVEGLSYDPDAIVSIAPDLPELTALVPELSQPTYSLNSSGKVAINKTPDGALSPNLADAVMILFGVRPGTYFAAPPVDARPAQTIGTAAHDRADCVLAMISFNDNAVAVVYFGVSRGAYAQAGVRPMFQVVDWALHEFAGDAAEWMASAAERLAQLRSGYKAADATRMFIADEFVQGYAALMRQLGLPVRPLPQDFPPTADRFNLARPYVVMGLTPIAPAALERSVKFRGASRNFLRELLSLGEPPTSNPLALAFASAVLAAFHGMDELPIAQAPDPEPAPSTPAARARVAGVFLAAGPHEVDGQLVTVGTDPNNPHWNGQHYPLPPGRHSIDSKVVIVANPNAGIRIGIGHY